MSYKMQQLPPTGFLRESQIIGNKKSATPTSPLIPVCRSTWYAGVKSGRFPQPVKGLGKRITAWRVEDILALIETVNTDIPSESACSHDSEIQHLIRMERVEGVEAKGQGLHRAPCSTKRRDEEYGR